MDVNWTLAGHFLDTDWALTGSGRTLTGQWPDTEWTLTGQWLDTDKTLAEHCLDNDWILAGHLTGHWILTTGIFWLKTGCMIPTGSWYWLDINWTLEEREELSG